jgi:hypothetical protein
MDRYNERYKRFSGRIEKGIIALIAACTLLLLASEFLYGFDPVRSVLVETERLEGISQQP